MENISPFQFWLGVLTVLAPQLYNIYARWRDSKDKEKEQETRQKEMEADDELKATEAWERLLKEYARQIESLKKLEVENSELRPLVLKLALLQQEMKQVRDDKADWKKFAEKLQKQIEDLGHVPLPFRRTPQDGDTDERLKTISRRMKAVQEEAEELMNASANVPATTNTPTIVKPEEEKT